MGWIARDDTRKHGKADCSVCMACKTVLSGAVGDNDKSKKLRQTKRKRANAE